MDVLARKKEYPVAWGLTPGECLVCSQRGADKWQPLASVRLRLRTSSTLFATPWGVPLAVLLRRDGCYLLEMAWLVLDLAAELAQEGF